MSLLQAVLSDPSQTVITYPTSTADDTDGNPPRPNLFQTIRKNWRQFLNILPGILLLWTAGVQILWEIREIAIERKHQDEQLGDHLVVPDLGALNSTFNNISINLPEVEPYVSNGGAFFATISTWHIGIAAGSAIGALLNKVLSAKIVYCICAILLLIASVLNVAVSQIVLNSLIFSDIFLAGVIYGINHVTVICHAADTSAQEIRGTIVRTIAYSKWFIILWASCVFFINYPTHVTFVGIAYIYAIVAFLVLLAVFYLVYNSFVQSLVRRENEDTIKEQLSKIRGEVGQPRRAQQVLDELKLQLNEDLADGANILANGNVRPLALVGAARLLSVLLNNVPLLVINISWLSASISEVGDENHLYNAISSVLILHLLAKLVFGWITVLIADCISLNRFYYVAAVVLSVLIITLHFLPHLALCIVVLLVSWAIGLGIDAISYNQLADAFPLTKRAWSIAAIHIFESLVEIVLLAIYLLIFPQSLVWPIAIGIIGSSVVLWKLLPNTHGQSLRNARDLFNNTIGRNANQKYELTRLNTNGQ